MASITVNGVELYYETHGKGTPLMLIAGLASDSQSWQPIIEDLSQHHLVITPDNRGVGRTIPQDVDTSIRQMADDYIALIRYLGLPPCNLLGHSMGGFIALDLAIRHPDKIDKLILAATSSSNGKRNNELFSDWVIYLHAGMDASFWFRNIFYWIFSKRFFENTAAIDDAVQFAINYPFPQSIAALANQVHAIADFDTTAGLSRVGSKSMVISGKEDILFPCELGFELAQAIPEADFSMIANAAHSIHMEQPKEFTKCVLDFLKPIDSR